MRRQYAKIHTTNDELKLKDKALQNIAETYKCIK